MRITGRMLRSKILDNITSALGRLQVSQTQMATGRRILKPSDDAIGISKSLRLKSLLEDKQQFQKNIEDAFGWLDSSEVAVDSMVSIVIELKEIAIEGANDTKTASERHTLAEQVEHLIERLLTLINKTYGDRYLFSGTFTKTPPYSSTYQVEDEVLNLDGSDWTELGNARIKEGTVTVEGPGGETYAEGVDYEIDYSTGMIRRLEGGSMNPADTFTVSYETETIAGVTLNVASTSGKINREVARGVYLEVNIGAEEILASDVNVFSVMITVKTALYRNDGSAVNASLDDIERALSQVSDRLARLGNRRNSFELANARLDTEIINLQANISKIEDADMAEVLVRFQAQQVAYESALAAASKMMDMSLINFIR